LVRRQAKSVGEKETAGEKSIRLPEKIGRPKLSSLVGPIFPQRKKKNEGGTP
jgi:hypothetical protein